MVGSESLSSIVVEVESGVFCTTVKAKEVCCRVAFEMFVRILVLGRDQVLEEDIPECSVLTWRSQKQQAVAILTVI